MIKLVAFDWNGTILADTNAVVKAESATRLSFGLPATTLKDFQAYYDIPIKKYWIQAGLSEEVFNEKSHQIHLEFIKNYEPLEQLCRTRTGTREILSWLKEKEIKAIIFSNHIIPHVEKQLRRLKISDKISTILARDSMDDSSHMQAQTKDKKLSDYVTNLGLGSSEVMVVGDTTEEIGIGKTYSYTTVALTGGYQSLRRLKAADPDYLIHNLNDLKSIIQQINGRTN